MKLTFRDRLWEITWSDGMTAREAVLAAGLRMGVDVHAWRGGKILRPGDEVRPDDTIKLTTVFHGG